MKDSVVIKGSPNHLTLLLDAEISFEQLVRDICTKFAQSRTFFREANLVLTLEGRHCTTEEASVIVEAIELNSDLHILLINENDTLKDLAMKEKIDRFYYENITENAKIITGSITKEDRIHSDSSLLILGDVRSKAHVRAAGNVIVMGQIAGSVHAGYPNDSSCYIVGGEIASDDLVIGGVRGQLAIASKWERRMHRGNKNEPVAVVVWEQQLLMEPLYGGLLSKRRQ